MIDLFSYELYNCFDNSWKHRDIATRSDKVRVALPSSCSWAVLLCMEVQASRISVAERILAEALVRELNANLKRN